MKECYGKAVYYNPDLNKIEKLSEDDKRLWIITKIAQLEVMNKRPTLKPIDCEGMNILLVDTLYNVGRNIDGFKSISCSVSGGSDSDVVIDVLARSTSKFKDINFVFFDTGIEYAATKRHLEDLEAKYGITIKREKAVKSIPHCCKEYGQPFLSKRVSDYMYRLQMNGFKWEDEPFDVLYKRYPHCKVALRWWCDEWGEGSRFSIKYNKWLKEFIMANPPAFKISAKCCDYAKKKVAVNYQKSISADLTITGVRKAEGGVRSVGYKDCMSRVDTGISHFRPIFWLKDEDKARYNASCHIKNSDCYSVYGLKRTGCAGCPFGRNFKQELEIIREYEPKLYEFVNNVFGDSYAYTKAYRDFVKSKEGKI